MQSLQTSALLVLLVIFLAAAFAVAKMHWLQKGSERWARLRRRKLRFVVYFLVALSTVGLVGLAWFWTVQDDVPDGGVVDTALDADIDPLALTLPAQGPLDALTLRDLAGKRAYFFVDNMESHAEGTILRRAVNRWVFPEDVVGFNVGDAPQIPDVALKMMEEKFLKFIRAETKTPIYVDNNGALVDTFKLPRGHMAFLVLGPQGEIEMRHSGDVDEARLEEIRVLLGAEEPPPPPAAPEFDFDGWNKERCRSLPCVFVFLDGPVTRKDIPRIEGGYEGEDEFEQGRKPGVRLAALATGDWKITGEKAQGLLIGSLTGITADGWSAVPEAAALRQSFGVAPDQAALIVVDTEGRLGFSAKGLVRFWQFGQAGQVLGLEARDMEMDEE